MAHHCHYVLPYTSLIIELGCNLLVWGFPASPSRFLWGCDLIKKGVVDEMGSLHNIIKSSTGDLMNNWLLVTWRQFRRTSSFTIFFISIHLFVNSSNDRLDHLRLNLMQEITLLKKEDDRRAFSRRGGFHEMVIVVEVMKTCWTKIKKAT